MQLANIARDQSACVLISSSTSFFRYAEDNVKWNFGFIRYPKVYV
jgi:hypothetical protein